MLIRIGTSGWNYPHWRGRFYPAGLPESEWLAYYARHFASVELNASFYRLPSHEQFAAWRQQTPAGFVFSVKASRYITHMKKLLAGEATLPPLLEVTAALGAKRGPLLFQLPPRWRVNAARLRGFLGALPPDCRAVFEFRDPSWHTESVRQLLEEYGAGWCAFDLAGVQSPRLVTAGFAYLRLHGHGAAYRCRYGRAALAEWAAWLGDQPVAEAYVYFDNDEAAHAVEDALEMQALLA